MRLISTYRSISNIVSVMIVVLLYEMILRRRTRRRMPATPVIKHHNRPLANTIGEAIMYNDLREVMIIQLTLSGRVIVTGV